MINGTLRPVIESYKVSHSSLSALHFLDIVRIHLWHLSQSQMITSAKKLYTPRILHYTRSRKFGQVTSGTVIATTIVHTSINLEPLIWYYRITVSILFTAWFFKCYDFSPILYPLPEPFELLSDEEWISMASSNTDLPELFDLAASVIWENGAYNPLIMLMLQLYFTRQDYNYNKQQRHTYIIICEVILPNDPLWERCYNRQLNHQLWDA